jgi:flavin-dependent dehydrogenase
MIDHEVIIVGGGPAGAAAAWQLVRGGVDCLVLDQELFPREKLCAGWITPQVLKDLDFVAADYPHRFLTFDALQISIKGIRFPFHSPQHSIRRFEFDQWLLERSGAPFRQHRVRHVETLQDGAGHKNGGEFGYELDGQFRCRYLIGAGGTRCPIYRELFKTQAPRPRELQIVTQELEFPFAAPGDDCHLWFFPHGLPGYSWYVPKENGYLNVGIGAVAGRLKSSGHDIKHHWQTLISDLIKTRLLDADPGEPGGYSYFLRASVPAPRSGNAFVIGDAAGLATRDMCEGIGPAVHSGLMAAGAILGSEAFELERISAHTLGQPLARRALDFAFTRNRN